MGKVGESGRVYVTKHLWLPEAPLERFNHWTAERIARHMPSLPVSGDAAVALFPEVETLRERHAEIRGELARILPFKFGIPEPKDLHARDKHISSRLWRTYVFKLWGHEVGENMRACPATVRAFSAIPGVHTALFSILGPRGAIPTHRGWASGVVRIHYPVVVPDVPDACRMRIGQNWHAWHERVPLLFDDTREHEVKNDTDQMRVVLIVDFEPRMPIAARLFCKARYLAVRHTEEIRTIRAKAAVGLPAMT